MGRISFGINIPKRFWNHSCVFLWICNQSLQLGFCQCWFPHCLQNIRILPWIYLDSNLYLIIVSGPIDIPLVSTLCKANINIFHKRNYHNVSDVWSLSCTSWLYFRPGVTSAALQMNSQCVFPYFKETQQWCERKMSHLLCSPVQITRGRKIDNHLCFSERIDAWLFAS